MNEEEEFEFRHRMEQEAANSASAAPQQEEPSYLAVAGNAAAKGAAGFADMFLNAPVNAYNVAKAGATLAGVEGLEITPQPNLVEKGARAFGLISDDREPQTPGQRILDMAVQAGVGMVGSPANSALQVAKAGAIGLASGAAAGVTKEYTGSDLAATAVGMTTALAGGGIRVPQSNANAPILRNPVLKQTAQDGMDAGLVIPPSYIKPSFSTNRIQGFAGKAATDQEAQVRNVEMVDNLARKAIGVQEGKSIEEGIAQARVQAGKAYEDIAKLNPGGQLQGMKVRTVETRGEDLPGPITGLKVSESRGEPLTTGLSVNELRDADGRLTGIKVGGKSKGDESALEGMKTRVTSRGQDVQGKLEGLRVSVQEARSGNPLEELKQSRADATTYFKHYNVSADPKSLKKAKTFSARAKDIEDDLERRAIASGKPELVENFREARTLYAKTYDIERALNKSDDHVSAGVLGKMYAKKKPLSGELLVIGKFAKAFPKAVRDGAMIQSPGVSGVEAMAGAGLGALGYGAAGGPVGLLAAGVPLLRGPARSMLLSKGYQNRLLKEATPASLNPAMLQSLLAGRSTSEAR